MKVILLLLCAALGAVFRAALLAVRGARSVERSADDVIAHAGQIFDAAAADQDDGVLLQVVADPGDVRRDLLTICEADARDFPKRRVRLLRRDRLDLSADATALRVARHLEGAVGQVGVARLGSGRNDAESRGFHLFLLFLAALTDQLGDRRHSVLRNAHESGRTTAVRPETPKHTIYQRERQRGEGRYAGASIEY